MASIVTTESGAAATVVTETKDEIFLFMQNNPTAIFLELHTDVDVTIYINKNQIIKIE